MRLPEDVADKIGPESCGCSVVQGEMRGHIQQLQVITLLWMLAVPQVAVMPDPETLSDEDWADCVGRGMARE